MHESGIAHRYAQALFDAARTENAVEEVAADMQGILAMAGRHPELRLFIEAPHVRTEDKHGLVDKVMGGRAQPLTVRFLHLLLNKKRGPYLRAAAEQYAVLVEEHRGVVRATVTTAAPLAGDQLRRLQVALEARTGKTLKLEPRVNADLIGGVVVQLGDQILDDSVRTRLAELREALLGGRS